MMQNEKKLKNTPKSFHLDHNARDQFLGLALVPLK